MLDGVVLGRKTGAGALKRPAPVALGLCPDGKKEVIDFRLARSESAAEWECFLDRLHRRGPTGDSLEMICVDGGKGLLAAPPDGFVLRGRVKPDNESLTPLNSLPTFRYGCREAAVEAGKPWWLFRKWPQHCGGGGRARFQNLMQAHHSCGAVPGMSETVRHVAHHRGRWLALPVSSAPALKCGARDRWVGWDYGVQCDRLHLVTNQDHLRGAIDADGNRVHVLGIAGHGGKATHGVKKSAISR